jgi:hypothetical protein
MKLLNKSQGSLECLRFSLVCCCVAASFTLAVSQTIDEVSDEVEDFQANAQEVYRLNTEGLQEIWAAYCGLLDPTTNEYDNEFAAVIGANVQSRQEDKWEVAMGQGAELMNTLGPLQDAPETEAEADELFETVDKEITVLRALEAGAVLKGSNHAFVQMAIEYGKDQHEDLCDDEGEDPKICDKTWPSLDGRPDLVYVDDDGLWIYEFKPNNSQAISAGEDQVEGYVDGVQDYFQSFFPNGRGAGYTYYPDSDHGGEAIVKKLLETDDAWNGDALEAQWKVVTYNTCDKPLQ